MDERKKSEEASAVPPAAPREQQGAAAASTRQPEQRQGKRQGHPVTLKEFLLGDEPISIKRAKGRAVPVKQLAETPLLLEAFAAERMRAQPKANKRQEFNLNTLGNDVVKWKKMQGAVEKEWNARCICDAATRISGAAVDKVGPDKILSSKVVWADENPPTFEPKARTCGRGYGGEFDDKRRRDSSTVSAQMTLPLRGIVASPPLRPSRRRRDGGLPAR